MVIPSEQLPFAVKFFQFGDKIIKHFHTSEYEAVHDEELTVIKENQDLFLTFEGEAGSHFYMDGLDSLPERLLYFDEDDEVYLEPCQNYQLFKQDYYPLIPGRNLITVFIKNKKYYAFVRIIPTQMAPVQWEQMVVELEEILKGLSMDLIRKNLGLGDLFQQPLPSVLLYQFMVIAKRFPEVMAALSDLLTKVNFRIRKEYVMEPIERECRMDKISVRYELMHPENKETVKVPKRTVDYDLPENRWIKTMIRLISNVIKDFLTALSDFETRLNKEITDLKRYEYQESTAATIRQKQKVLQNITLFSDSAIKMLKGLEIIKHAPWYDDVSDTLPTTFISPVLMSDSRYFALYKLFKELRRKDFEITIDPTYSYQYKRTDKLYEMWGFLKVCQLLRSERLGFKPVSGWIYDSEFDASNVLIPTLAAGTTMELQKDDLFLRVTYDRCLPSERERTTLEDPVYTISNFSTPDGKIDFFKAGMYIGSILFDMKCRKLNSFFSENALHNKSARSRALNQLISYSSQCRSPYYFNIKDPGFLLSHDVVHEVWALFPAGADEASMRYKEEHKLRLIRLCPGDSLEPIEKLLDSTIKKILDHYQEKAESYQRL